MVAHSLHRHSELLVNTLERIAVRVVQEIMKYQYSPTGPALGSLKGELPSQTRPPVPYAFAAPEQHSSPAYVMYKVGGDPAYHQFFSEPPRRYRMGMFVRTYQTAVTRRNPCRGQPGEHL
jgi:hypothetical protein